MQSGWAGVVLVAEHVQHSDIDTTRKHYIVPSVETSGGEGQGRASEQNPKTGFKRAAIWELLSD